MMDGPVVEYFFLSTMATLMSLLLILILLIIWRQKPPKVKT